MSPRKRRVSLGGRTQLPAVASGFEDATPERLAQGMRAGEPHLEQPGIRRFADPFDVLRRRGLLDRDDKRRNDLLWEAGDRFRQHWHKAGLDGIQAFDFTRETVDGTGGAARELPSEAALRHREKHRAAAGAVGTRLIPYLHGMVVEGRTAASLSGLVTDTAHARTAEALVIERLREALERLIEHWGMRQEPVRRGMRRWTAEGDALPRHP